MEEELKRNPQEQDEAQEEYASEQRGVGLPEGRPGGRRGNGAAVDPPSQASEPQEVSRRRQDPHRDGRDSRRSVGSRSVPA